ncbi:hypothetical protein LEMLEM_LOCUS18200 [Lemmus lemmus]
MEHPGGLRWGAAPRLASPGVRSGSGSALGKPPAHLSPGAEILPPVRPGRAAGPRAGSPGMRPSVSPSDARREIAGIHAQFQSNSVHRQRENYEWMLPSDEEVDWGGLCARRAPSKQGHWPLHCFNAAG